jgi:hypothetical protein
MDAELRERGRLAAEWFDELAFAHESVRSGVDTTELTGHAKAIRDLLAALEAAERERRGAVADYRGCLSAIRDVARRIGIAANPTGVRNVLEEILGQHERRLARRGGEWGE